MAISFFLIPAFGIDYFMVVYNFVTFGTSFCLTLIHGSKAQDLSYKYFERIFWAEKNKSFGLPDNGD